MLNKLESGMCCENEPVKIPMKIIFDMKLLLGQKARIARIVRVSGKVRIVRMTKIFRMRRNAMIAYIFAITQTFPPLA